MSKDIFGQDTEKMKALFKMDLSKLPEKWDLSKFYWGTSKVVATDKILYTMMFGPVTWLCAAGTTMAAPLAAWNGVQLVGDDKQEGFVDSFVISVQPLNRGVLFQYQLQGIQVLRNGEIVLPQTQALPGVVRLNPFTQWMYPSPEPINCVFEPIKFRAQDTITINLHNTNGQNCYFNFSWMMRYQKAGEEN
jgi:hypothetical protein